MMSRTHFTAHFGFITLVLLPLWACPAPEPVSQGDAGQPTPVLDAAPTPAAPDAALVTPEPTPAASDADPAVPVTTPVPALPGGPEGEVVAPPAQ